MSDLSDLHGVFPTSLRWNAELGVLGISVFNPETGERELQEIELGKPATFVMDLATRERGYGKIKTGVYEMALSPVGSPPPPWPDDDEFKPAIGVWLWCPAHGELRLETNATIFRQAVTNIWDTARFEPQAAEGQQPIVSFVNRIPVPVKAVNKVFSGPVIKILSWVERNKVPGWANRPPTVAPPAAMPMLAAAPAQASDPAHAAEKPARAKVKARQGAAKPEPEPPPFDDEIPW
jgi:hypothetical protein